ncbi:MAG: hypothetical protein GX347_00215 [Epulopiscium sp.]|nr:hypothetical protein [Candidatus Epulonipiscium sp.]
MEKKFAYFVFPSRKEDIPLPFSWMWKMPETFVHYYIKRKQPFLFSEVECLGVSGYKIQLPFLLEEVKRYTQEECCKIIEKAIIQLDQSTVDMVALPEIWKSWKDFKFKIAKGRTVCLFFILSAILKIIEILKKPLQFIEVTLIAGDLKETDLVMDILYPHVNFFTLIAEDKDEFLKKTEEIYADTGLSINLLQKTYTRQIEGDIIINLSPEDTSFYFCKKGTIYFDFGGSQEHTKKILLNRRDLCVIDDFSFYTPREEISSTLCELVWYSQDVSFRRYQTRGYFSRDLSRLLDYKEQKNLSIRYFYQYGTLIKSIDIQNWYEVNKC